MTRPPLGRSRSPASGGQSNAIIDIDQQCRRSRIQLRRIPEEKQRRCTFQKRKKGLLKKAGELSKMCDVKLCLFSTGHADPKLDDKIDVKFSWSVPTFTVDEILAMYEATPQEQRDKKKLDYVSHLDLQIRKTEKESDNMKLLNTGLEEEIHKRILTDIQSVYAMKLEVDAKLRDLGGQQHAIGGMTSDGDQALPYPADLSATFLEFPNGNQPIGQEYHQPGVLPLALSGLQQYGNANVTVMEEEFKGDTNNEDQGPYGSQNMNPQGMETSDGWDACNWDPPMPFGSPSKAI